MKFRLLDLFCGAGGCSAGYVAAGFDVTGVDNRIQSKYPYRFVHADALTYVAEHWHEYDAIHASPPCQEYSASTQVAKAAGATYPDLIAQTRLNLQATGKPYVIENVPGSPLLNPVMICGGMFGMELYRHRLFETSFTVQQPIHYPHIHPQAKMGRMPKDGEYLQVVGHFAGVPLARRVMGISWMGQKELAQAIPPRYTEYIGRALLKELCQKSEEHQNDIVSQSPPKVAP